MRRVAVDRSQRNQGDAAYLVRKHESPLTRVNVEAADDLADNQRKLGPFDHGQRLGPQCPTAASTDVSPGYLHRYEPDFSHSWFEVSKIVPPIARHSDISHP